MRKFALLVLVVVFGWSSGAAAAPIQWTASAGGNTHWYEVVPNGVGWNSAKASAESLGGYLATITSEEENAFLTDLYQATVASSNGAWLGGVDSGGWGWITSESWDYTNWNPGQPDGGAEKYLVLYLGGGWEDYADAGCCSGGATRNHAIIEYDTNPIPEPSTALLLGVGLAGLAMRRRR